MSLKRKKKKSGDSRPAAEEAEPLEEQLASAAPEDGQDEAPELQKDKQQSPHENVVQSRRREVSAHTEWTLAGSDRWRSLPAERIPTENRLPHAL